MPQLFFNPFSWSIRRRNMLMRCPREYFYHYYGSAGGAFVRTFTEKAERLHLLRALLDTDEYVRKLIFSQLRTVFNSGSLTCEGFSGILEVQFRREFRDMMLGRPETDHKRPLLRELFTPGCSMGELEEKVISAIRSESALFEAAILPELLSIPAGARLRNPFPLPVRWNDLNCFVTPVVLWSEAGTFCAVCTGTASEENRALLSLYALDTFQIPPEKVRLFYIDAGRLLPDEPGSSFTSAFRQIRQETDRMLFLEAQLRSGQKEEKIFPQDHRACLNCRFASYCS